jgi:hypothetical protein
LLEVLTGNKICVTLKLGYIFEFEIFFAQYELLKVFVSICLVVPFSF